MRLRQAELASGAAELDGFDNGSASVATARRPVTTSVIVPAFNEEDGIAIVLEKLCAVLDDRFEIIVVDDGSTDATAEIAGDFGCTVISHPANAGKASAVRTGIAAAAGDNIIVIDADDTYPVDVIPEIARELEGHDMVVTLRTEGRENIPWFNRFGNGIFRALIRHLYGFMPRDPLTGLYGLKRDVLLSMSLDSSGFGVETELTIKAGRMGLNIHEIPITYRTRIGEAKLHGLGSGLRILQTILKALALFSPTTFFVLPGVFMLMAGVALMALIATGPVQIGDVVLQTNSFVLMAMLAFAGFQTVAFGIGLDLYSSSHRYTLPGRLTRLFLHPRVCGNAGRVGLLLTLLGLAILAWLGYDWVARGAGDFPHANTLVAGALVAILGLQMGFSSSFLSVFVAALRGTTENLRVSTTLSVQGP